MTDDSMFRAGVEPCDFYLGDCRRCGKRADRDNLLEPCARGRRILPSPAPLADDGEGEARAREAFDATRGNGTLFWHELTPYWQQRLIAMLAFARTPATVASGWRTMESAPRDASRILIATPDGKVCEAWWARDYEGGPGYWSTPPSVTGRGYTILPDYPTHWRPLPAAPTDAAPSPRSDGGEDHG